MTSKLSVCLGAAVLLWGCSPYSPDLGDEPFRCGTDEPRCPDGYQCYVRSETDRVCVPENQDVPDPVDAGGGVDAESFACNDDGPIDDNNTIGTATPTPIPDIRDDYQLLGLSICPSTDIDIYSFRIDQSGKHLRAEIEFDARRGSLLLDVLNSSGLSIRSGVVADGDPDKLRAEIPNMAADAYYVQVQATPGVENNYSLLIVTTAP